MANTDLIERATNATREMQLDPKRLEALARAFDKEDSAQRGEFDPWMPEPWDYDHNDNYPEWYAERLACAEAGIRAYLEAAPSPSPAQTVVEAARNFMLLFIEDGIDPPSLTTEVDPNELANRYEALSSALATLAQGGYATPANPAQVTDAMVEAAMSVPPIPGRGPNVFDESRMRAALTAAIGAGGQAVALPSIPDDDGDFTPELARKIIAKYQAYIRTLTHPAPSGQAVTEDDADVLAFDAAVAAGRARVEKNKLDQHQTIKPLDDDQIMEIIKDVAPWKDEPKFNDLLTYEKSPPLFPQATYDVPSYRAVNFVRAVEKRLSAIAHPVQPGWRGIESAPKDGDRILVIGGRHLEPEIVPADGDWWRYYGGDAAPTHWMPLPAAPQPKGE